VESILKLIVSHLSLLYREKGFKFVDSGVEKVYGESSFIVLSDGALDIILVKSRDGLDFEFRLHCDLKEKDEEAFSFEIVKEYIDRGRQKSDNSSVACASYVRDNIDKIISAFSNENYAVTKKELKGLEVTRSKRLFGKV
jgi:hypothetical protein